MTKLFFRHIKIFLKNKILFILLPIQHVRVRGGLAGGPLLRGPPLRLAGLVHAGLHAGGLAVSLRGAAATSRRTSHAEETKLILLVGIKNQIKFYKENDLCTEY